MGTQRKGTQLEQVFGGGAFQEKNVADESGKPLPPALTDPPCSAHHLRPGLL